LQIKRLSRPPKCRNAYYCEAVSERRAARCIVCEIVAPGGPDQRRWEAHPGIPPPVPRVKKHETPERETKAGEQNRVRPC
jgi:hypothetical protein